MHKYETGKTYKDVKEKMKQETIRHNTIVFASDTIGVHGKELPKFAESPNATEYWKLRTEFYNPAPENNSRLVVKQNMKYWAKPDEFKLADAQTTLPSPDVFKSTHVPKESKEPDLKKVNEVLPGDNFERPSLRTISHKWSSEIAKNYKSIYSVLANQRPSFLKKEQEPLYSSFSPNKTFDDPFPDPVNLR